MEVERGVTDLYRAFVMKDRVGERMPGIVTAVVGSGVFVAVSSPFIDVLVRLDPISGPANTKPTTTDCASSRVARAIRFLSATRCCSR